MQGHCTYTKTSRTNSNFTLKYRQPTALSQSGMPVNSNDQKNALLLAPLVPYLDFIATPEARRVQEFILSELKG